MGSRHANKGSRFVQEVPVDRMRTASCAPAALRRRSSSPRHTQPSGSLCTPEGQQHAVCNQGFKVNLSRTF